MDTVEPQRSREVLGVGNKTSWCIALSLLSTQITLMRLQSFRMVVFPTRTMEPSIGLLGTWTSENAQNNGPASNNEEYRQFREIFRASWRSRYVIIQGLELKDHNHLWPQCRPQYTLLLILRTPRLKIDLLRTQVPKARILGRASKPQAIFVLVKCGAWQQIVIFARALRFQIAKFYGIRA